MITIERRSKFSYERGLFLVQAFRFLRNRNYEVIKERKEVNVVEKTIDQPIKIDDFRSGANNFER